MGKRELLLVVGFLVVGVALYQVAAPPDPEGRRGFSIGQLIESARREIQGNQARAEREATTSEPLSPDADELRIERVQALTVIGEERADLGLELKVVSTGFDAAEAQSLAEATIPRLDSSGRVVTLSIEYPEGGRQTATLTVRVPSRLRVRVEGIRSESSVEAVASLLLQGTRGDLSVARVPGAVEGEHAGGTLSITSAGAVSLTTRSCDVELAGVARDTRLDLTGGSVRAGRLGGGLDITGRSAEIEVDGVGGAARIDVRGGEVKLAGIAHEVRFDGRSTDLTLALDAPAPVTAITADGTIVFIAPPRGGFTLDAVASSDRVRVSGLDVPVGPEGEGQRARGDVAGGGPTVALRATSGPVDVRAARAGGK